MHKNKSASAIVATAIKFQGFRIIMLILIGSLFLSVSSVYAQTVEDYFNRGKADYIQGNYVQAISDFSKAIEINPNYASIFYGRAMAYYMLKEYDMAWIDVHSAEALGTTIAPDFMTLLKTASGRDN